MTSRPAAPGAGTGFTAKLINAVTGVSSMEQADREVPESETPETDALVQDMTVLTQTGFDEEPQHVWEPDFSGLLKHARSLERRLSLAQTEIKGHMRVKDDLQSRIAELEKERDELKHHIAVTEALKDRT